MFTIDKKYINININKSIVIVSVVIVSVLIVLVLIVSVLIVSVVTLFYFQNYF